MLVHSLVVVMPAYNEAEGLPLFLREVLVNVEPLADEVHIVVVNDKSTDGTSRTLHEMQQTMPQLVIVDSETNRGHGPTALAAYMAGLALGPNVIVHVDGDGQFVGEDFPKILRALEGVDVVHGVRTGRTDPWFRRVLTSFVATGVAFIAHTRIPDVNTPLRAYRPHALERLLAACPANALVPHVHFSIAESRLGMPRHYVHVHSIPRRGSGAGGTMWGETKTTPKLPPRKLLAFSLKAAREVWRYSIRRSVSTRVGALDVLEAGE